jgi:hypothetical protein
VGARLLVNAFARAYPKAVGLMNAIPKVETIVADSLKIAVCLI